jgi:hypothetical protein
MGLMNGLSALGAGVAQYAGTAGLELQKAQLAQQQTILADQLATTRETGLQQSAGAIAATAAGVQQGATAALATQQQGATAALETQREAAAASEGSATRAADMARTQATINAPPEQIKLLRALGVPLPGDAPPASSAPASGGTTSGGGPPPPSTGPRVTGGIAADGSVVSPSPGSSTPTSNPSGSASSTSTPTAAGSGTVSGTATASPGGSSSTATSGAPGANIMDNPIVQKALGYPAAGSEEALRRAVASDVKSDPAFKYQTVGQQATETELRVNVAKGAMTSPATQLANATLIAGYQIKPPDGYALSRPGGAETMALVGKLNPDYQEGSFPEVNKAMTDFGTGKEANIVRSLNVGVQHLATLDLAGQALGNGNVQALNALKDTFQQPFGSTAQPTFEGLKQIVGTEVEKAVAGGIGSAADRDRIMQSLKTANSPAQLQAVTNGFRDLMVGQLSGLKTQYEDATGFKDGRFAFETKLSPATTTALRLRSAGGQPSAGNASGTTQTGSGTLG